MSVVMAVRDGAPWLRCSIGSILGQTLGDFELILVDDGSGDSTREIMAWVASRDLRVRLGGCLPSGLSAALNQGLYLARAPYVARMDADDWAEPDRLAQQAAYLDSRPEVGILGSAWDEIDGQGRLLRTVRPPTEDRELRRTLIRHNPFCHPSVMARRDLLLASGGYDTQLEAAQDYDLWLRLAGMPGGGLANLADPCLCRRLRPGSISAMKSRARRLAEARARFRAIRRGQYPTWCFVYVLRPMLALLGPDPLWAVIRRTGLGLGTPVEPDPRPWAGLSGAGRWHPTE